jgi:putative alpha-1,2-mannosidase
LGETEIYNQFIKRSENWKNNFDKTIGFMRPRLADGSFKKDFDVLSTHGQGLLKEIPGTTAFCSSKPNELITMMGGKRNSHQNSTNCSLCIFLMNFCRH